MPKKRKYLPLLLIILDGWGIAPPSEGNAISGAKTPNFDRFIKMYPAMTLQASGPTVGLQFGEMGNSEVGHANIGSGRVAYQSLQRISKSISDGSFFRNHALLSAMQRCVGAAKKGNTNQSDVSMRPRLHLLGIISDSGVHGHIEHLFALLVMAKELGVKEVFIHAFLDGRDSIYNSGIGYIEKLKKQIKAIGVGEIATMSGRFYAMDRDNRWDRVKKTYNALVYGKSDQTFLDATTAIKASYEKKIYDEEFLPTVLLDKTDQPRGTIRSGDGVIFFNFRADRARQLTHAFVQPDFKEFKRGECLKDLFFVTMTEYEKDLPVHVAFQQEQYKNTLGEVLAQAGLRQLRVAETEKYAHVTFFLNGLSDVTSLQEEHLLIPSPKVRFYNEAPLMSAKELTTKTIKALTGDEYDVVVINFANADMVGHTGDMVATVTAVEALDRALGELVEVMLSREGVIVITSDHGNAEEMKNLQTGEIDKEHSNNPVPLLIIGSVYEGRSLVGRDTVGSDLSLLNPQGVLSDVAPTILKILDLPKPEEMTGTSLI